MDTFNTRAFAHYGSYKAARTGILLIDPYNDFLHPDGKSYNKSKEVIEGVKLLENMARIIRTARELQIKIFYVPHHRSEPTDFNKWKYPTMLQLSTKERQVFAKDSWGGQFHESFQPQPDDIIIKEHWSSSGFANTDLDEQLKQLDIDRIILIGMIANTCIEATGRFGMELGYHVTLVKDATAANNWENMHAAHDINGPAYAHAILTSEELIGMLKETVLKVHEADYK
ncbi:isochorismatase [Niastella yeongjuensis]|uniref:Isochorismatase n=1 Tax=Niastella yeongjuensis TaxID=354355 RepID=A0A1V9DXW2_9BACT|nr:isochorismatase family cysteine hydrolase [Niastella yeongjuensis]OQP38639.1 isochorismatase [Niastella yeongjuensis]SEO38476.1 Nicotinamidase-related amidase [Niastella yeongjuensis]